MYTFICISYVPVTVIKHHEHSNLSKEGLILAYVYRGKTYIMVVSGMVSGAGNWRAYFYLQTQSGETKPEVGPGYELSQTLPTEYFLQQDCTISPNSATNWGSRFQIPEPMGNILIQATIHKYPFMHIHVGTHVVLWIHRNAIINNITIKSFICDSSRDSCVILSLFFTGNTKIETLS